MNEERNFRTVCIAPATLVRDAMRAIDAGAMAIALVIDGDGRLLGTVTDGDIRRGILRGLQMDDPIATVMHRQPVKALHGGSRDEMLRLMRQHHIGQLPIVDTECRVVGLELLADLLEQAEEKDHWVVLLAGGLGTRLLPLTEAVPKPLLKVGSRALLDVLIEQIASYGFRRFLVAVNYRAEMVEHHLGDGRQFGVQIEYVREPQPLGTVGAVRLVRERLDRTFIVVNGDLLTRVNFEHLLEFHETQGYDITVGVKEYEARIPYGVVELASGQVCALEEKPTRTYLVNAGIYALRPGVIDLIPEGRRFDMTDLVRAALEDGRKVGGFPIHEYWLDIGAREDYERANGDYLEHFGEEGRS